MKHIPRIQKDSIKKLNLEMKEAQESDLVSWLTNQLDTMKNENPKLYEYFTIRAQRFSESTIGRPDTNFMATFASEMLFMLTLIDLSLDKQKKLDKTNKNLETFINDIEGLDEF